MTITEAAAPQIIAPAREAATKFVGYLTANSALSNLLMIIGGGVIAVFITLLLVWKFKPDSQIGGAMRSNANLWGAIVALLFGVLLVLPNQIIPFLVGLAVVPLQILLSIADGLNLV